jgi:hypothetical protein
MGYRNFDVAVYCPVGNLNAITDLHQFEKDFRFFEKHVHIDKVYLETYRSNEFIDREKILRFKEFFNSRGIKTSGGITTTDRHDSPGFHTLCYTNGEHRSRIKSVSEFTAGLFDEIILDDFYFTNCKCESCIKAKGSRSWAEFRLGLMKEVTDELIVGPARKVNPKVNYIIKYPNWYEHFHHTGYNLEDGPKQFDMLYTGTETRDPLYTYQHLPKYLGYFIMRYFENIMPGRNGGGWFDPYECRYNFGSYAQQAYLTIFGKAREVTLFCLGSLMAKDFEAFIPVAGQAFNEMDEIAGSFGRPVGIAAYRPLHSEGEDYLHNYIGMLGIPLEPYPRYPASAGNILLTESAAGDEEIVDRIRRSLLDGGNVTVTSGLVKALGSEFRQLADVVCTDRKAIVREYAISHNGLSMRRIVSSGRDIILPQLKIATNDTWQLVSGLGEDNNFPVFSVFTYGRGRLYILTIPDDFGNLYHYPEEVLKTIREAVNPDGAVNIDTAARVALFTYDNDTFVLQSFLRHPQDVKIAVNRPGARLLNLVSGKEADGLTIKERTYFTESVMPEAYRAYRIK